MAKTILVVEDSLMLRKVACFPLEKAGYKVVEANNGIEAIEAMSKEAIDLIITDLNMPGMDGFEACTGIRRTALNRATPVVFVTGQNDFKTRARMGASGGSDFVAKPFLTSEITLKALTFALRGRLDKLLHVNVTTDELPTLVPQS